MKVFFIEWNASYEKLMIKNLKNEHAVIEINNAMKHFTKKNIKLKKIGINSWFVKIHVFLKLRKIKKDDLLICNGYSILGFLDLIKEIKCKKALVIRDTMIHLENEMIYRKKWLMLGNGFINEVKAHFDKIYSFDPSDCQKYNLIYLNQFLPFTYSNIINIRNNPSLLIEKKNRNCFFVGEYRTDREQHLKSIALLLKKNEYIPDFYLIDRKNEGGNYFNGKQLSYEENINKVISSEIIVEINHKGQDGLTLRTIEAIAFNKKIITNNIKVMDYDFYTPNRFFILDYDTEDNFYTFISCKIEEEEIEIIKKYTAEYMLQNIKRDFNLF
ncbi:hypothetical protein [Pectobacterium peruviense]|uniref:Lipopolysaccharide biosynthesis protein n=1 Tax=Pectobacterium peruviense TaxID=2066479 RepID=A0ABX4S517_9GAMM|nr:hypothetical protein [Pectobacterium peruviense]KML71664.1 hypothetical protein G033_00720 [Pectobacterium peruviense]PKX83482.1 hypothetical protein A0G02_09805 [Pectobacterium peruviense]PKX85635.1 hypothetical protein A0G03_14340 [Pectobacterium peruviense]